MDNEIIKKPAEDAAQEAAASTEKVVEEAAQPAFEYKAPVVEAPVPPTVNDIKPQPDFPVEQPQAAQYQQPQAVQYQQPQAAQYQQPQAAQYQQPQAAQYQQPQAAQYQQPQAAQFQQPQAAQYQQPQATQYHPNQTPQAYNQQPYYQYAPVNPAYVSQQNTVDGFATASLICGIGGLLACCTVIPSLLAIIFGAISKVKNDGTRPTGMSTAGLILGIIGTIINVLIVIAMFFYD